MAGPDINFLVVLRTIAIALVIVQILKSIKIQPQTRAATMSFNYRVLAAISIMSLYCGYWYIAV